MYKLFIILFAFSLFSCDPVRRHNRLTKKYPYVHTSEVKIIRDTIKIHSSTSDTVTHYNTLLDTVHLVKDRLKVQVYRVRDSVFIEGECKDTTIIKEHHYKEYSSTKEPFNFQKIMIVLLILATVIVLFRIFWRK